MDPPCTQSRPNCNVEGYPPASGPPSRPRSLGPVPGHEPGGGVESDIDGAVARDRIEVQRSLTHACMQAMTVDHDAIIGTLSDANIDDEHDPEGSTIAFERAQVGALLDAVGAHLSDLDHAVAKLRAGTYGRCEQCGRPVGVDRLAARPAARTCIGCASPRPGWGVG